LIVAEDWVVAADPSNAGRGEAWWKSPRLDARPVRVPGIFQEALPGYHGVAWYWRQFVPPQNCYPGGCAGPPSFGPFRFDLNS